MFVLLVTRAAAHGGEDHGGVVPEAAVADAARVPTWSTEFEAVLRLDHLHAGEDGVGTLLLASWATSAPVDQGSATLDLQGPSDLLLTASPTDRAGEWTFPATFPAEGPWSGSLTVVTADRADALGLPSFSVPVRSAAAGELTAGAWAGVGCVALGGALLGLAVGAAVGFVGGRRAAGAAAGLVVGLAGAGTGGGGAGRFTAVTCGCRSSPSSCSSCAPPRSGAKPVRRPTSARWAPPSPDPEAAAERARPGHRHRRPSPTASVRLLPGELGDRRTHHRHHHRDACPGADRSVLRRGECGRARSRLAEARKRARPRRARRRPRRGPRQGTLSERERLERERGVEAARARGPPGRARRSPPWRARPVAATTVLRAPIAGRLGAFGARPGATVDAGAVLARVHGSGGVWVDAHVPEALAGRLVAGSAALLVADARPDEPIAATVLDPGLEADPATGAVHVVLAPVASPDWLRPGMTVAVQLAAAAPRQAVVVPDAAIVDSAGETLVFVKTSPESFEPRPVRVGGRSGARREVVAGLDAGERVVVQGTWTLRSLAGR
jgi:RND family efflux transporter MFP subunit